MLFSLFFGRSFKDSAYRDNFTSAFLIQIPFISFSWLDTLVNTSCTKFNRNSESGPLCVVSGLRGKAFIYSLLSLMLLWSYHIWPSIMTKFIDVYILKGYWVLLNTLSPSTEMIMIFSPHFVNVLPIDFCMLNHSYTLDVSHSWAWYMCCWIWIASILMRILICLHQGYWP